MKPVHIEFIEGRQWRMVWLVACFCCLGLVGVTSWQWTRVDQAIRAQNERILTAEQDLARARMPEPSKVDLRRASLEQASRFLQLDYNKAFSTVEKLKEPGVRLRGLSLDSSSGILRLEYDLDAMLTAAALTSALNAGYENKPWKLESVSGSAGGGSVGIVPAAPVFRGVWAVQFGRL